MRKGVFIWRMWVGKGERKTRHVREETAEMEEAGIPSKTKENSIPMLHLLPRNKGRDTLRGSNACAKKKREQHVLISHCSDLAMSATAEVTMCSD